MATILVIEDDHMFRSMLCRLLSADGYTVVEAEDGVGSCKKCIKYDVDLVVTDLVMPNQEGIETIMQIRRECPAMKIIAVSGGGRNDPNDYLNSAVKLGANLAFSKPLDTKKFLSALAELLAA